MGKIEKRHLLVTCAPNYSEADFRRDSAMAALAAEQLQVGAAVKAQLDYTAANADELTVVEGDTGTIASVRDDGWGTATFAGTTGLIPLNHLTALSPKGVAKELEVGVHVKQEAESQAKDATIVCPLSSSLSSPQQSHENLESKGDDGDNVPQAVEVGEEGLRYTQISCGNPLSRAAFLCRSDVRQPFTIVFAVCPSRQ